MQADINKTNLQVLLRNIESNIAVKESTILITGILLNNVLVKNVADINQINGFVSIINQCVDKNHYISNEKRQTILLGLMRKQFLNLQDFQSQLIKIYDSVAKNQYVPPPETQIKMNKQKDNRSMLTNQQVQQLMRKEQQQRKSLEFIKQLELRQEQSFKKRKPKQFEFGCAICLENIQTTDLAYFTCQHSFHRNCAFKHFSHNIDNRNFPLKCPECNQECKPEDIFQFLNSEYLKKYDQRIFEQFVSVNTKDMSWCPTAGCKYVFSFNQDQIEFNCQLCKKHYCLKCKVPFHKGMNCKQFSINRVTDINDEKFIEFVQGAKYKQCPNCKFWVEKTKGCDHMTCRCKYQFCYVCGGKYKQCPCPRPTGGLFAIVRQNPRPAFSPATQTSGLFGNPRVNNGVPFNAFTTSPIMSTSTVPNSFPSLFQQGRITNLFS